MVEIACLGELLIDFVPTESGVAVADALAFKKAPGGAPANVAVGLARLGVSSAFVGQVGNDAFGRFLADTLIENGVDVSGLRFTDAARTALAFVSLTAAGERDFMFYRHPSADMLYRPEDVDTDVIAGAQIFHFGSISLIDDPARAATLLAAQSARAAGRLVSYDPNLRLALWPDADAARAGIRLGWPLANVIKVSEDELRFLTSESEMESAARSLWHDDLRLLFVTQGANGCTFFSADTAGRVPGFGVEAVDATGAGDAFVAAVLRGLLESPSVRVDSGWLYDVCRYANAAGALTTTGRGAIPSLPTEAQVREFLTLQAD